MQNVEFVLFQGSQWKENCIYVSGSVEQWNVLGADNIGKFNSDGFVFFYYKDHLGSVRVVADDKNAVVSAQDGACPRMLLAGDAWGYIMPTRSYQSDDGKFKFTGKERDEESGYDYFGARYYDARVGDWMSVDPLMEKHFDYSPYNYVLRNPLKLIDPDGKQVDIIFGQKMITDFYGDIVSGLVQGQLNNEKVDKMSTEEKATHYGMSLEDFSKGTVEATGHEMYVADFSLAAGCIGSTENGIFAI